MALLLGLLALTQITGTWVGATAASTPKVIFKELGLIEAGGIHNIHVQYSQPIHGRFSLHYGNCNIQRHSSSHHALGETYIGDHPLAKRHLEYEGNLPTRFVWLPPLGVPNGECLHAFADDELVGSSKPIRFTRRITRRQTKSFADVADPEGPWFDGVQYLKQKQPDSIFVAITKAKQIGIIGGGMAGLMTSFILDSVGIHNWRILEASDRVGGRVHTSYLNATQPEDYQYQEMGPMRFPVEIKYSGTNETLKIKDHDMVFQLADAVNARNGNKTSLKINFIPWLEESPNAPVATSKRRPDGTVPGSAELAADPRLGDNLNSTYSNATLVAEAGLAFDKWVGVDSDLMKNIAANVFRAHKEAIRSGKFDYSEAMFLRYVLNYTANITDQVASIGDYHPSFLYENVYFSATSWKTIDKGLSSLPRAMEPFTRNRTTFGIKVSELKYNSFTGKISAHYRKKNNLLSPKTESSTFDYAIIAVPFTNVRLWKLPKYSSLLSRAISTLGYEDACKVALHYKSRFWERLRRPIIGGCGATDIPGVGNICYPSYAINSSGPGVLLANYNFGAQSRATAAMPEDEHVALIQRAMVEVHGPVAEREYTGLYDRVCWGNVEFQGAAWASPLVGQEDLYLPAYFQTEFKTVFVGEHTSYTHAWIFSALESAVRGTAQLLLDMGLVDEAKLVTKTWMARWMSV